MPQMMKVIDAELFGNVVRFALAEPSLSDWHGDDWDDVPYEHNAGGVYEDFVGAYLEVALPLNWVVAEPCDGHANSSWSKDDMRDRRVPMVVTLEVDDADRWAWAGCFDTIANCGDCVRVYMGDVIDVGDVASWLGKDAQVLRMSELSDKE